MITVKDFMELVNFRITEGSKFCWHCYGNSAYFLDSWNGDHDGHSLTIIFDTRTQEVYEVQAHDYLHNRAYRMFNPDYRDEYMKEASSRGSSANEAWDNVSYVELETVEDFMEKATAIVNGEEYDTRVSIPLEIPEDELLLLFKAAHERDMTFNEFLEEALKRALKEFEENPDQFKQRVANWKESKLQDY